MSSLYIYYKVESSDRLPAKAEVDRILAFAASHQVAGRLMRRPESTDGVETWMEIYDGASANFAAELENFAARTRLLDFASERRLESFVDWW